MTGRERKIEGKQMGVRGRQKQERKNEERERGEKERGKKREKLEREKIKRQIKIYMKIKMVFLKIEFE